jgi:acetyl-CoA carboxylase biotin carboxyl carrier protein
VIAAKRSVMPPEEHFVADRVRHVAAFVAASGVRRVRIERDGDVVEVSRPLRAPATAPSRTTENAGDRPVPPRRLDAVKADLVGIFRFGRPAPFEGEVLEDDRELAFIEALGIRNPVRSLGAGRIVTVAVSDGTPVEYGQPLFLLDRE